MTIPISAVCYKLMKRVWLATLVVVLLPIHAARADDSAPIAGNNLEPAAVDWLEPRGLNVVDLVGLVPEAHLRDAIVSYEMGILQYISGQRSGNTVTVKVRVYPQYVAGTLTIFSCLGQTAAFDQWPSTAPASTMRVYAGNTDVTAQANTVEYWVAGQVKPINGPSGERYQKQRISPPVFDSSGALQLPANNGCRIFLTGYHENLTADFTVQTDSPISIQHLGSQTFDFHSYIGPGEAGQFNSLRSQMEARWPGIRHDKFDLAIPPGADYVLVTFPPTPVTVNPFGDVDRNLTQPSGGSYRLSLTVNNILSVDHVNAMGLPIQGQWQDAGQAGSHEYLPFFKDMTRLASPEYFIPPGFSYQGSPYHPCMTHGGCPTDLLDAIYNATAPMTIHYYQVTRTLQGLTRIPLRQVGSAWSPGRSAAEPAVDTQVVSEQPARVNAQTNLYLPSVLKVQPAPPPEPDDPAGCPCGWFDALGRMFDYIPPQ